MSARAILRLIGGALHDGLWAAAFVVTSPAWVPFALLIWARRPSKGEEGGGRG